MTGLFFHYTTVDGLLGIVKDNSIRATDLRFLNDSCEGAIYVSALKNRLMSGAIAAYSKNADINWTIVPPAQKSPEKAASAHVPALVESMVQGIHAQYPRFSVSLVAHEKEFTVKNGLLSQWRGYGADGGICLVLARGKIHEAAEAENEFGRGECIVKDVEYVADFESAKVEFGDINWDEIAADIPILIIGTLEQQVAAIKKHEVTFKAFIESAPFFKHHAFEEEKEVRILFAAKSQETIDYYASINETELQAAKLIEFRSRAGVMVPYVNIFEGRIRDAIQHIIIGPSPNATRNKMAVQGLIDRYGLSADTSISEIPLV